MARQGSLLIRTSVFGEHSGSTRRLTLVSTLLMGLASGPSHASERAGPVTISRIGETQQVNEMHSMTIEHGALLEQRSLYIDPSIQDDSVAESYAPGISQRIAVGAKIARTSSALDPGLDQMVRSQTRTSSHEVCVIVSLNGKFRIPRFPNPRPHESRSSRTNRELRAQALLLIDELRRSHSEHYDQASRHFSREYAATEEYRYWITNAMVMRLPVGALESLGWDSRVAGVSACEIESTPPGNRIQDGREMIRSDFWYANGSDWIGLLDTGVRFDHALLPSSRFTYRRDCANSVRLHCPDNKSTVPEDDYTDNGHGTASASILGGGLALGLKNRGVTGLVMDSWKVWRWGSDGVYRLSVKGLGTAFESAIPNFNRVIVAEVQIPKSRSADERGTDFRLAEEYADGAYDAGAVVIAAAGNAGTAKIPEEALPGSIAAPGSAHKALAVGAINVNDGSFIERTRRGPTKDSRTKPDVLGPSHTLAAIRQDDRENLWKYTGTSGATPYIGGAAALVRSFLVDGDSNVDPGQTYSVLIAAGNNRLWRLSKKGAGLVELPWSGKLDWGKFEIGHKIGQKYRFTVTHSAGKVSAAVWWPDGADSHSDIDLVLYDPSGEEAARSQAVDSVFEKLEAPARQGEWTIEVFGFDVRKNRQNVYLSVIR